MWFCLFPLVLAVPSVPASAEAPLRLFAELPMVHPRGLFLQTESEAVELVGSLLAGWVRDDKPVSVRFDSGSPNPSYAGGTIHATRFLTSDPGHVRAEFERFNRNTWGMTLSGWSDADLLELWQAWWIAAFAREYAHAIRASWGRFDEHHLAEEERLARAVEAPVLDALAATGRIPAHWPALYRRFLDTLVTTTPAAKVSGLPPPGVDRERVFDEGCQKMSTGEMDHESVRAANYLALLSSQEWAKTPRELDGTLRERLAYYPSYVVDRSARAVGDALAAWGFVPTSGSMGAEEQSGTVWLYEHADGRQVAVWVKGHTGVLRAAAPLSGSRRRVGRLALGASGWNQDLRSFSVSVRRDRLVVGSGERALMDATELAGVASSAVALLGLLAPSAQSYLGGELKLDDAVAAPYATLREKGYIEW